MDVGTGGAAVSAAPGTNVLSAARLSDRSRVDSYTSSVELRLTAGRSSIQVGALQDGIDSLRLALENSQADVDACRHFVSALELLGPAADANAAWFALGTMVAARGQFAEAVAICRRFLAKRPGDPGSLVSLGSALMKLGEHAEATKCFREAVTRAPDHALAHVSLAWASHLAGDADRGWDEFAWFCRLHPLIWRAFEQPLWDGSPLAGRTILLWAAGHYGLGDTIHHLRYVTPVSASGGRVIVECQPRLVALVERMAGVHRVVSQGTPLPYFDVHAPLLMAPVVDRAMRRPSPAEVPYLHVDNGSRRFWSQRLGRDHLTRVGLSWGGQPQRKTGRGRAVSLKSFAPLAQVRGTRFISLQVGPQAQELLDSPPGFHVESVLDQSWPLAVTAALILELDLLITVDTMVAHLAGALGRPVWTLVPYAADWRWAKGEATPWYPTMRLFRQDRPGDWTGVFDRVRTALQSFVSAGTSRT